MIRRQTKEDVGVGSKAPDFTLSSQSGEMVNLSDSLGRRPVVLYFYPKDDTPGCTMEACAFRDEHDTFAKLDAEVIGVSSDSVQEHKRFAEKHHLDFTLLSDEGGKVRKLYGVPNTCGVLPGRVTYVIDKEGMIQHIFSSQVKTSKHVEEALKSLKVIGS